MGEKYHCIKHYFREKKYKTKRLKKSKKININIEKINSNIVVIYEIVVYIFPSLGLRPDIP